MDEYSKHIKLLEHDIHPEVKAAIGLITIDPDSPHNDSQMENLDEKQLEKLLLNIKAEHYEAAKYKRQGMSYAMIAKKMGLPTPGHASRMVEQVLTMGYQISTKGKEQLRQQVLDTLDDMMSHLYTHAEAEGREYLKPDEVKVGLNVIDSQIKILGVTAPQQVSVDVSARVKEATDRLQSIVTSINKSQDFRTKLSKEGLIIDGEITEDKPSHERGRKEVEADESDKPEAESEY